MNEVERFIAPFQKDEDWYRRTIRANYNEFVTDNDHIFLNKSAEYDLIMKYAKGQQDINDLIELMTDCSKDDENYLTITKDVFRVIPGLLRNLEARLAKTRSSIQVFAVDPLAEEENKKTLARVKTRLQMEQAIGTPEQNPMIAESRTMTPQADDEPRTLDEFETSYKYTVKHRDAVEMELAVSAVLNENKEDDLRKTIRRNIITKEAAITFTDLGPDGRISITSIPPERFGVSRSEYSDFRDSRYFFYVEDITIQELRYRVGDDPKFQSSDVWYEMAMAHRGMFGNPRTVGRGNPSYNREIDEFRVRVVHMDFLVIDRKPIKKGRTKYGNKVASIMSPSYASENKSKVSGTIDYPVFYAGSWIMGTNYVYGCGPARNVPKNGKPWGRPSSRFLVNVPDMYDNKSSSILEDAIPLVKAVQSSWMRYEQSIYEARPLGYVIDLTAIENIPLGKAGKALKPMSVLDLFKQKGILVVRKRDQNGRVMNAAPVDELKNSTVAEIQKWFAVLQQNIQMLKEHFGINDMVDAKTPDPRILNHVADMAQQNSDNAIAYIHEAEVSLMNQQAESIIKRIGLATKHGMTISGYTESMGIESMNYFSTSRDLSQRTYSFIFIDEPTTVQRQELKALLMDNYGKDLLMPEDIFLIDNTRNIKLAQLILSSRIAKRKREAQEFEIRKIQENAKGNEQAGVAAEKEKQNTAKIQMERDVAVEAERGKWNLLVKKEENKRYIQVQDMKAQSDTFNTMLKSVDPSVMADGGEAPTIAEEQ